MNLEDIKLSKAGQSPKDTFCRSPLLTGASSSQIQREREENTVARDGGGEGQPACKEHTTPFCTPKSSGDGQWAWWCDHEDVLPATDLHAYLRLRHTLYVMWIFTTT